MILTNLYYCNLAWGGTYKTNLQRIVIAFMIKFPYNARSDWLKQRTLSENKEQVNDTKFCFGISTNLAQIKHSLCESDKININKLFVSSKYGAWRPSLTTVV